MRFLRNTLIFLTHLTGVENRAADALSRVVMTLHAVRAQVIGFDRVKDDYSTCPDFGETHKNLLDGQHDNPDFVIHEGYLFKGRHLCIP